MRHRTRTTTLLASAAIALAAAPAAHATPFELLGDGAANSFEVRMTAADTVEMCTDGFCFGEPAANVSEIIVRGFEGSDTLSVHHEHFLTNGTGGINLQFDGGTGVERLEICPAGCAGAGVESTTYEPGLGSVIQSAGAERLAIALDSVATVADRSPGALTVEGSAADDVIGYGPGSDPADAQLTIGPLVPYDFSNKATLTVNGREGGDRFDFAPAGTPADLGGDCGDGRPICFDGGSSSGDELVVHGVPALHEDVAVRPLTDDALGQRRGTVSGIAATPAAEVHHRGIEAIDALLQSGADDDRLHVAGGPGDDRFELTPSPTPRQLAIDATLDPAIAVSLPALTVTAADAAGVTRVDLVASVGGDEVVYHGTGRDDAVSLRQAGLGAHSLEHAIDGHGAYAVDAREFERLAVEGADGDDALTVAGDVVAATGWGGGNGADTLALRGTGAGRVAVALSDGTVAESGFGTVRASGTERFDVDAGGNGVDLAAAATADVLRYTPAGAQTGLVARDGDARTIEVRGVGGLLRLDPGDGHDTVVVRGTASGDQIPVARDAVSGTVTAQVGAFLPATLAAGTEALRIDGAEGEDRFVVTGSGGPDTVTVDGGGDPGADTLAMAQDVHDASVRFEPDPSAGTVTAGAPVGFLRLEAVQLEGDAGGTLTVNGSAAPDALTQSGNRVTAGAGASVSFAGFPALALDGSAGDDRIAVNPRGTSGVAQIAVGGGEAGGDALTVNGTEVGEQIRYAPAAPTGGRVEVTGAPPVAFADTETLAVDGRTTVPSGDRLVVDTTALDGTQELVPGPAFDAGTVEFRNATGTATTAPAIAFARLGTGALDFGGAVRRDRLVYRGSDASEAFSLTGDGQVRLDARIPVHTASIQTLVLNGRAGDDTFNLPAVHPFPGTGTGAAAVVADGGDPDSGDAVNVTAGGRRMAVDLGQATVQADGFPATALVGIDRAGVAGASELALLGSADPDVLRYTPTGSQAGSVSRDGASPQLLFTGLSGTLVADARGGADQVVVQGRSVDDATAITRGEPTTVAVDALKPLQLPAATESLRVLTSDGADTTTVTGSGGPASLTVAGGLPAGAGDRLAVDSVSPTVTYDPTPTSGVVQGPEGTVGFLEMEALDLHGGGNGTITVGATNAPDTITVGTEVPPAVLVNDGAPLHYAGYPALVVDGRGGADAIDVSYANLGDLRSIRVLGGGSLSDELTIADRLGTTRTLAVRPTAADAGAFTLGAPPDLTFETTESLAVDGMGGGDELRLVTPPGGQRLHVLPGATDDAGSLQLEALVPVRFQRLGAGRLRVADAAGERSDEIVYDGGPGADAFGLVGDPNAVSLGSRPPLIPDAALRMVLNGLDGDDTFTVTGPLPFAATRTDGSGPDRADSLTVAGPSGPITADLGTGTLTGYGGTIAFPGIEQLATDAGGGDLTQIGRAQDDALCYDPMSPRSGRAYVVGAPGGGSVATVCSPDQRGTNILHTFTDVGRLRLDPVGGADQVILNGTTGADLATMKLTYPTATATLHPDALNPLTFRLPAEVVVDSTESLAFAADNGADIFDVTTFNNPAPVVFLDGEDPAPKRLGDELRVRDGTGRAHYRNVTGHEFGTGTVFAQYRDAFTQRIDYTKVEEVTMFKDPRIG